MSKQEILESLAQAVVDMDRAKAQKAAQQALDAQIPPFEAISKGLSTGMKRIGELWNAMEIFLPEVMAAVNAYYAGLAVIKPHIPIDASQYVGTAVFGTIYGDIHSVGKDVVVPVFQGEDFNVIDLGIDVPPEKYIEAIIQYNPDVVGLGTYMSETFLHANDVIDAFKEAGVRDRVIILCGGPAADDEAARKMGADGAFRDAWDAVAWAKKAVAERVKSAVAQK